MPVSCGRREAPPAPAAPGGRKPAFLQLGSDAFLAAVRRLRWSSHPITHRRASVTIPLPPSSRTGFPRIRPSPSRAQTSPRLGKPHRGECPQGAQREPMAPQMGDGISPVSCCSPAFQILRWCSAASRMQHPTWISALAQPRCPGDGLTSPPAAAAARSQPQASPGEQGPRHGVPGLRCRGKGERGATRERRVTVLLRNTPPLLSLRVQVSYLPITRVPHQSCSL